MDGSRQDDVGAHRTGPTPNLSRGTSEWHVIAVSSTAEKIAEVLAWPERERAYLAHQLIASLESGAEANAEEAWMEVIDRRSSEIEQGQVDCRTVEETVRDIRAKLNARRHSS
jgi:hypothetical protein